jgi:diguanylate cyclase (GGDEF)-like protein
MSQQDSNGSLFALKRRIYLFIWPFGVAATLLCWMRQTGVTPVARLLFAVVSCYLVAMAVMLLWWKGKRSLRVIERSMFGIVAVTLLARFYDILLVGPLPERGAELAGLLYWLPLTYVLAHIAFDRKGNVASLLFFAAVLIPQTVQFRGGLAAREFADLMELLRFDLANAIYIALLFAVAALRRQYTHTLEQARTMTHLAHTDAVTGISNRRYLNELLVKEVERARRFERAFSVILFDLDHFKNVNDAHGHGVGDQVLQNTARMIGAHLRPSDELGRWGGDEFLILSPESDAQKARQLAERLRQALAKHPQQGIGRLTGSFGVAASQAGEAPDALLKLADEALYRAKQSGRNRVEVYQR